MTALSELAEVVTVKQAAGALHVSRFHLYRMLEKGDFPGAKIGGTWRILRADIEALFKPSPPPREDSAPGPQPEVPPPAGRRPAARARRIASEGGHFTRRVTADFDDKISIASAGRK